MKEENEEKKMTCIQTAVRVCVCSLFKTNYFGSYGGNYIYTAQFYSLTPNDFMQSRVYADRGIPASETRPISAL